MAKNTEKGKTKNKRKLGAGYRLRSDGRFEARFTIEKKRYTVYGHTLEECKENERKKREEIKKGLHTEFANITLNDFFKKWSENRRIERKASTVRKQGFEFSAMAKQPVDDAGTQFGTLRVKDITKQHCLDVRMRLLEHKKVNSTNQSICLLKQILEDAVDRQIIEKNPARSIKAIEVPRAEKDKFTVHRALTIDETVKFLEEAKKSEPQYYNLLKFLLYTGMRHGEAGALTFADIVEESGSMAKAIVCKTITKAEDGQFVIGDTTKTKAGVRTVALPDEALDAVKAQRKRWMKEKGRCIQQDELIFTATDGGLCDVTNTTRACKRICKKIGAPEISCHALRATYATRFVENSGDYKVLAEILGHKNITVTMNTYAKALDTTKEREIRKLKIV